MTFYSKWGNNRRRACYHLGWPGLVGQSISSGEDELETGFVADQEKPNKKEEWILKKHRNCLEQPILCNKNESYDGFKKRTCENQMNTDKRLGREWHTDIPYLICMLISFRQLKRMTFLWSLHLIFKLY